MDYDRPDIAGLRGPANCHDCSSHSHSHFHRNCLCDPDIGQSTRPSVDHFHSAGITILILSYCEPFAHCFFSSYCALPVEVDQLTCLNLHSTLLKPQSEAKQLVLLVHLTFFLQIYPSCMTSPTLDHAVE